MTWFATRVQMERGLGMIVIDYLQLMSGPHKRRENRQQEVSDISRDLKILAKDLQRADPGAVATQPRHRVAPPADPRALRFARQRRH